MGRGPINGALDERWIQLNRTVRPESAGAGSYLCGLSCGTAARSGGTLRRFDTRRASEHLQGPSTRHQKLGNSYSVAAVTL